MLINIPMTLVALDVCFYFLHVISIKTEKVVNGFSLIIANKTLRFIKTAAGKCFLTLSLLGPIIYLPTLWKFWTADNIDALRTLTWLFMPLVHLSALVGLCHNGDWRLRLSMMTWLVLSFLTVLALIVR